MCRVFYVKFYFLKLIKCFPFFESKFGPLSVEMCKPLWNDIAFNKDCRSTYTCHVIDSIRPLVDAAYIVRNTDG